MTRLSVADPHLLLSLATLVLFNTAILNSCLLLIESFSQLQEEELLLITVYIQAVPGVRPCRPTAASPASGSFPLHPDASPLGMDSMLPVAERLAWLSAEAAAQTAAEKQNSNYYSWDNLVFPGAELPADRRTNKSSTTAHTST